MDYIVPLSKVRYCDRSQYGFKASRLGELLSGGFPVPPGFCLTIAAYELHLSDSSTAELQSMVERREFSQIRNRIQGNDVSGELAREVLRHYERLRLEGTGRVAVRSSSTAEDLEGHSFAGLYDTRLGVCGFEDLLLAIRECWASYWSDESVVYRELAGIEHDRHGMSVLVQAMVEPVVAGVLFTENPLEAVPKTAVVELVDGVGESLVDGDRRARRIILRRGDGTIVEDSERNGDQSLTFLPRLTSLGLSVEERFGESQDIEWAAARDGGIWLLQTRPVTEKSGLSLKPGGGWHRAYEEPFSTLGCDLARQRHSRWIEAINALYRTHFQPEFQETSGWVYFRAPWRSPGRRLWYWMQLIRLVNWFRGAKVERQYENLRANHLRRLNETEAHDRSALSTEELSSLFMVAVKDYLDLQYWSYPSVELAKTSAGLLERLCNAWFTSKDRIQYSDLLSGLDNLSVQRDLELHRVGSQLAELVQEKELESFDEAALDAVRHQGSNGERFWQSLQDFLAEYGYVWADRYPRDPTWKLSGDAMAATLAQLVRTFGDFEVQVSRRKRQRQERMDKALAIVSRGPFGPLRRLLFCKVLAMAESHFPRKEERNHDVYRSVMVIRKLVHEIGRRLESDEIIPSESDVALLTTEELVTALRDGQTTTWRNVVDRRRPHRQIAIPPARTEPEAISAEGAGPLVFSGEPCSPGVGRGPACVVRGFDDLRNVRPGDIVLCRNLRPAWSTVFIRANGVVVETGSLLSHGATLAREYGVAAVMNVGSAINHVADGDSITVDGNIGTVTVEPQGAFAELRSASA